MYKKPSPSPTPPMLHPGLTAFEGSGMKRTAHDKLLVLDLDETLIHTNENPRFHKDVQPDFSISGGYLVCLRPGVQDFLEFCFTSFREVMIWTAGTEDYAYEVLNKFTDPSRFVRIWDRGRCSPQQDLECFSTYWRKDIAKITRMGYDKEKILCVDDTARNFDRSYGNLIQVRPFHGDPQDTELVLLQKYLNWIGPQERIRAIDKRDWRVKTKNK
jgi:TFIIF-interacting CTD phosphatase-like protein